MRGLYCPDCGTDRHNPIYEKDGLFVCSTCKKILGYLCNGCDKVYLENRLAFFKSTYVCKECGTTQWGYTEWKRIS